MKPEEPKNQQDRSQADNVYQISQAKLGDHPSGFKRDGVVKALSYPETLERAWRNYGWPFWVEDD